MKPFEYSGEVQSVTDEPSKKHSAQKRHYIPGGFSPSQSESSADKITHLPEKVHRSSSDRDDNNSEYPDLEQTLTSLKDRHGRTSFPDAKNIFDPIKQFGRSATRLNPISRKIQVGRETEKIIDYGSRLLDWTKKSAKGKGTDEINTIRWLAAYANCKHPLALKSSDGATKQGTDEINTLRQLAAHPYHKYLFGSKSSDEGTELGDTKPRDAALTQLTQIAQELQAWDQYRLGTKDRPPTIQELKRREERELERRKNIEHLLQQLPEKRPSLLDLPTSEWWQLYIDKPDHEKAKQQNNSDPGAFYDKEEQLGYTRSPGYQKSMEALLDHLATAVKKREQKEMDYEMYTEFHELATKYVPHYARELMRQPNGLDRNNPGYTSHGFTPKEPREDRLEQLAALKEMSGECYNGLPLFQDWPTDVERPKPFVLITPEVAKALPRGITIGHKVTDSFDTQIGDITGEIPKGTTLIIPLYSTKECPKLVDAILKSYYEGRKVPGQSQFDRLREILRHIRALHTMHPKSDANGRANLKGLLNLWLIEEGFCPTISHSKPSDFRGNRTLDGLVEAILIEMHDFIKVVNQCKQQARTEESHAEMS